MSQTPRSPALLVPCPQCHKAVVYSSTNPWRPFCSEPCKQIDLGAWANESFRLPEDSTDSPDDAIDAS